MAVWTLYARNPDFERIGEIDTAAKLEAVLRFNDVGTWALTLPTNSPSVDLLPLDGSGIVLRRDGVTIFSGPITTIERGPFTMTISGVTDEIMLADRLALPVTYLQTYTDAEFDYRAGVASTVMRQYVNQNTSTGGGTQPDRQIAAISYPADPLLGNSIEARARFVPLLELLQECALAGGGLRFRLAQSDDTASIVYFYVEETEVAEAATFSAELGNLDSWTDIHEAPSVNAVYAGGRGLNENRPIEESRDQASVLAYGRRVERFLDVRETEESSEMQQAIATELEEGASARVVTLTPIDTPNTAAFDDYNLGDLARVVIDGETYSGVIRQLDLTFDKDGALVKPTIASPGASADPKAYRQTRELTRRVARLERNGISIPDGAITVAMIEAMGQRVVGEITDYAGSTAPTGWLLCEGQSLLRASYAALFAVIGTTYGAVDGTHFTIPDARGRFVMGPSGSHARGTTGGVETLNLDHVHGGSTEAPPGSDVNTYTLQGGSYTLEAPSADHTHPIPNGPTWDVDGDTRTILPPYWVATKIIFAGV